MRRVVVSVSDLQRGLAVYSEALGLPVVWANDEVARLDAGGVEVMLHRRQPVPGEFDVAATFAVDDVDAVAADLVAAGAAVVRGPVDESWGERQAVLRDPDGQVFCVITPLG
ncbi:glyoxalase [Humibacter ginsenosidimutans]|uniref:Glyoxalase n=1 Tax=Humibacter ginsenosidimutans TaxID=2599293 RepID=A0A5B8M8K1_9MICO|nr:glyoxalase [Humibacter ginsenosidimutans]